MVKPRMVSEEEKQRKAALLAQYADVTDEEDEADEKDDSGASTMNLGSDKCILLLCPLPCVSPQNLPVGPFLFYCCCWGLPLPPRTRQAGIVSPSPRTALKSQVSKNFPLRKIW